MLSVEVMIEVVPSELQLAVEWTHGGIATYVQSGPVKETDDGGRIVRQEARIARLDQAALPKDGAIELLGLMESPLEEMNKRVRQL